MRMINVLKSKIKQCNCSMSPVKSLMYLKSILPVFYSQGLITKDEYNDLIKEIDLKIYYNGG